MMKSETLTFRVPVRVCELLLLPCTVTVYCPSLLEDVTVSVEDEVDPAESVTLVGLTEAEIALFDVVRERLTVPEKP